MDTSWITLLTSAGGGGLFGIATKALSAWINLKQSRINNAHELQIRKLDIEEAKVEAEGVKFQAKVQAETDRVQATFKSKESARKDAVQRWSSGVDSKALVVLDFIRGTVRPVTIYYLEFLATLMWFTEPTTDIRAILVHAVVAWLSGALAFYYGGREYQPPPMSGRLTTANPLAKGIPGMGPVKPRRTKKK